MDELLNTCSAALEELGRFLAFDSALLMTPEAVIRLALLGLLLTASAFFSSAETALFSLSRLELRDLRRSNNPAADTIHELLDQPRRLIISILCGNEIINVAATANMASILLLLYSPDAVLLINMLVMVPLLLLLGEVTPKTIAVTDPVRVSTRIVAAPMALWVRLATPLRWLVSQLSERATTMLTGEKRAEGNILRVDELRTLVEEVVESGELHAMERALIDRILAAGSTEVREIMLPRTHVAFIDATLPMSDIVSEMRKLRHRQLPVYRDNRDNVLGMLYAEDLARHIVDGEDPAALSVDKLLRPVAVVPSTRMIDELFGFFLVQEVRAAVVVDEFGGVEGLVTLGDLIAFVFGHGGRDDAPEQQISELGDGVWEVDGALKISKLNSLLKREDTERRFTTVAGLMLHRLELQPAPGDSVTVDGATLRIVAMEGLRISRVRIEAPGYVAPPSAEPDAAAFSTQPGQPGNAGDDPRA